jgi:Raf kinase inhibitor-like YbhB/YbcL family protein
MPLVLTSPAFAPDSHIPMRFTSQGENISPPLAWSGAPAGTRSFALVMEDPDTPDPTTASSCWVHCLIYNIAPMTNAIAENDRKNGLPSGARAGMNDFKRPGYAGPSPMEGRHRYFFRLYALDVALPDLHTPNNARLQLAMKGHVLAEAQLVGLYQKR